MTWSPFTYLLVYHLLPALQIELPARGATRYPRLAVENMSASRGYSACPRVKQVVLAPKTTRVFNDVKETGEFKTIALRPTVSILFVVDEA